MLVKRRHLYDIVADYYNTVNTQNLKIEKFIEKSPEV